MTRITTFAHDGLIFDVADAGPADGEPVVLLHGFPERAGSWDAVAALLHAEGYRTLAPDQRGYSPGARPPRRRDHRMERLTSDVAALAELAGAPVHVVGHDWGALVAWSLAATRPELVRTLTAVSVPHPGAFVRAAVRSRQLLKSWYVAFFQLPRAPEAIAARRGGLFDRLLRRGGMRPEELARFRTGIVDAGALPGGLAWYRALPWADRTAMRRPVRVPTTMLWSDGDAFVGRSPVDETARFVEAPYELVVLPGVTHWIPTQAPEAAAAAILRRITAHVR